MDKVPPELSSRKQWCLWKTVDRDGEKTKLPFQPHGEAAKSNDPSTWRSFTHVLSSVDGYDGIGFVFSADDPFVGIDLDGCRNAESGQVEVWAREIIKRLDSYAEISPSQTGVKIFCAGEWRFDGGRRCSVPDAAKVCDKVPGIEVYSQKRYFAVTGQRLSGISPKVEARQDALDWLAGKYFTQSSKPAAQRAPLYTDDKVIERARKYIAKLPPAVSGQRGHDKTFHVACVLVLGFGLPPEDAFALLTEWNQTCDPPWTERELRHKVDSATKQPGERNYLRDAKPEDWDSISVPRYGAPVDQAPKTTLRIQTLEEAARRYLKTLDGGGSSLLETGLPELDHAIGGGYELGEMIILAARPSHGKSAIALQMAHTATACGFPVVMISEEMSALALGKRVAQFASEIPQELWANRQDLVTRDIDAHFEKRSACFVIESCGSAVRAVEEIEKAVETRGVKLAVVDYAQLLTNKGNGRYEQTTNTSVLLRGVASRHGIAVIVLCQLNRDIEKRTRFVPQISDLKETGQFEQDADVILFLVWPHRVNPQNKPDEYMVFVGKNRNRPILNAALKFRFLPSRQMLVREHEEPQDYEEPAPRERDGDLYRDWTT